MAKTVKIQPTPDLTGEPVIEFNKKGLEALVWTKGYDVIIESAIKCPCKTKNNDNLSTCTNCLGVGWVFINAVQDRAILSSINFDTQYKEWSGEKIGTVNVTVAARTSLAYMDKITVVDSDAKQSEVIYPIPFNGNYFSYTIYDINSIQEIFQFISPDKPLLKLEETTDFTFERNKILLVTTPTTDITSLKAIVGYVSNQKTLLGDDSLYRFDLTSTATPDDNLVVLPDDILIATPGRWIKLTNLVLSVRYFHKLQYYVLDIPHAVRNSYKKNNQGRDELQILPLNYIARLVHYVVDAQNFAGDNIINNSYE